MNYNKKLKEFTVFNVIDLIRFRDHLQKMRGISVDDFFLNFMKKGVSYLTILEKGNGSYDYFISESIREAFLKNRSNDVEIHMSKSFSNGKMLSNVEKSETTGKYNSYIIPLSKEDYDREGITTYGLECVAISLLIKILGGVNK